MTREFPQLIRLPLSARNGFDRIFNGDYFLSHIYALDLSPFLTLFICPYVSSFWIFFMPLTILLFYSFHALICKTIFPLSSSWSSPSIIWFLRALLDFDVCSFNSIKKISNTTNCSSRLHSEFVNLAISCPISCFFPGYSYIFPVLSWIIKQTGAMGPRQMWNRWWRNEELCETYFHK